MCLTTPRAMTRHVCRGGPLRSFRRGVFPPSLSTLSSSGKSCYPLQKNMDQT